MWKNNQFYISYWLEIWTNYNIYNLWFWICILKHVKSFHGKDFLYDDNKHIKIVVCYSNVDYKIFTLGYCVSIDNSLISWNSRKQNVVWQDRA